MAEVASREELEANLGEYKEQLKQVEELLLMDGENVNDELNEMYRGLVEVIQLTEELLKEAVAAEAALGPSGQGAAAAAGEAAGPSGEAGSAHALPPQPPSLPGLLPASVAEQIRKAQIRAALAGQAPASWLVGAKVQAVYSADGQYYDATVEGVAASGNVVVAYEGYAEKEEIPLSSVRERPEAVEVYTGVAAPKRKRVEDQPVITEIPAWLKIKEGDDEKMIARKKKLLKSYKSKMRFQNMDLKQKEKADSWQNFISGKGSKKKTGFFTGGKKESMFKVPEGVNSKVGVIGSGKGMTQYNKLRRVDGMGDGGEDA